MPRQARVVVPGYPHHITQRGNNRQSVFFLPDDYQTYCRILIKYSRLHDLGIIAWCLMPNHVHLLASPEHEDSMARCMAAVSLTYTQYLNRRLGRSGRIWQNRYYSCPVDSDSYLWAVAGYIERNPVAAGMVGQAVDYSWSSARHHLLGQASPLVNQPLFGLEQLADYADWVHRPRPDVDRELDNQTRTGRPFGSVDFTAHLSERLGRSLTPPRRGRPKKRDRSEL